MRHGLIPLALTTLLGASTSLFAQAAEERHHRASSNTESQPRYIVTELAAPSGAVLIKPRALNDHGQAIGEWLHEAPGTKAQHYSFFWDRGKLKDLGPLEAWDLNNQGVVVGRRIETAQSPNFPAVLWRGGKQTVLDFFSESAENSSGYSINNRGQVIGIGYTDEPFRRKEFLWQHGKVRDLHWVGSPVRGVAQAAIARATSNASTHRPVAHWWMNQGPGALNNKGHVAGTLQIREEDQHGYPIEHAGVWKEGKVTDLSTLPGFPHSSALALNDHGTVIGEARSARPPYAPPREQRAVIWEQGKVCALALLPGGNSSKANAVNNRGQVVGGAAFREQGSRKEFPGFHAVLWEKGRVLDLHDVLPTGSKVMLLNAVDINERGQILCEGMTHINGQRRAYLLSPQR